MYNNGVKMSCNFNESVKPCVDATRDFHIQAGQKNGTTEVSVISTCLRTFSSGVCHHMYCLLLAYREVFLPIVLYIKEVTTYVNKLLRMVNLLKL